MAKKRADDPKPSPPPKRAASPPPAGYEELLNQLKERIRSAQVRAAVAVNRELVLLYWQIGREILARQDREGWGAKVIDRLAADLRRAFPEMTGLSPRNLKYMRSFGEAWPDEAIVQGPLAQITWYHNIALLEKVKAQPQRLWYAHAAIEHGWSRNVLVHWVESDLYQRQGKATTNFSRSLPPPQSDLAAEVLKDPYNFEVRHDNREGIADTVSRILGRRYLSRPTYLEPKGKGDHSLLVKRRPKTRCPNRRAARLAGHGES